MRTTVTLLAGIALMGALGIWLGARAAGPGATSQQTSAASAATASIPESGAFDEVGTIVIDSAPSKNQVAYILFTRVSENGKPKSATKRLVFPAAYACDAGDIPCVAHTSGLPVSEGDRVHVTGAVIDDTVRVENIAFID